MVIFSEATNSLTPALQLAAKLVIHGRIIITSSAVPFFMLQKPQVIFYFEGGRNLECDIVKMN